MYYIYHLTEPINLLVFRHVCHGSAVVDGVVNGEEALHSDGHCHVYGTQVRDSEVNKIHSFTGEINRSVKIMFLYLNFDKH